MNCFRRRKHMGISLVALLLVVLTLGSMAGAFPRTVVDGLGNEIHLASPPQRIFSTGLAMDNLLLAIVDPSRVVGVTRYAPESPYIADRIQPHMFRMDALNPEYILAANPDLVLVASWNDPDAVAQIRQLGYRVFAFSAFDHVDDALTNLRLIGLLTGDEATAAQLIGNFESQYNRIASKIAGRPTPRVLYWNSWGSSVGSETAVDDIIRMAGGTNVVSAAGIHGWPQIDFEFVLTANPDVIITDSGTAFANQLANDPVLGTVNAIKHGHVYQIDHMDALNHFFILAIEDLAHKLHPNAMGARD